MTELWAGEHLRFGLSGGTLALGLALAVGVALLVLAVYEQRKVTQPRRRQLLLGLRALSVLALLAFVLRPQWVGQRVEHVPGRLAVLLDVSRSMQVRDAGATRRERALDWLRKAYDAATKKPELFAFGAEVTPISRALLDSGNLPMRDDTRLGRALSELVHAQPEELGAVILISDGADRSRQFDARSLSALGVRVHTVSVGAEAELHDTAITGLRVDPVAFLRQPAELEVSVHSSSLRSAALPVTLRRGTDVVRESSVQLDDTGNGSVTLSWTPTRLGRSVYTVSIPTEADDAVPENNERGFLLRVTRERLRALLVCGHPTWDARFLRAFLKSNPAIDLITFFILRTQNDNSMAPPEELSLIPFPTEELFEQHLASFDLVVFQDFDFGPYQMSKYLPRIRDYVLAGGSFAMLGGDRSFGAGGYAGTPIAQILPVTLPRAGENIDEGEFTPNVVAAATHHPVVELAPRAADNAAAWRALAPLAGTDLVAGLREGAHALLVHPSLTGDDGTPMPVLSVGAPGKGRALALTTDSAYRWGMATAGRTGDASAYERFWDRALRWLARDPLLDAAQVSTDRESYGPGGKVRATLWLRDDLYRPLGPGSFRLILQNDRGENEHEVAVDTDAEGRATVELNAPERAGAYVLAVVGKDHEERLAEQGFVVETGGDELADPRARPGLLREIAEVTQGETFSADDAPPALDRLPSTRTRVLGSDVHSPFGSGWFFAVLVGLLALEWAVRRRFGLR
ncbi:MAG TPA: glutamine amidotransferase [Polyangiales bacterium]|nr:glutamine amidotransferase [Polyangiales bacterium]